MPGRGTIGLEPAFADVVGISMQAPLAEAAEVSAAGEPPLLPRDTPSPEPSGPLLLPAEQQVPTPLPPLKVSGADLCSTAALVRLVAAAAHSARTAESGSGGEGADNTSPSRFIMLQ